MPLKGSSSSTIKDYLSTTKNQSGKNKNSASKENNPTMPKESDAKASKQSNKHTTHLRKLVPVRNQNANHAKSIQRGGNITNAN